MGKGRWRDALFKIREKKKIINYILVLYSLNVMHQEISNISDCLFAARIIAIEKAAVIISDIISIGHNSLNL